MAGGTASARTSGPDLIVGHVFECESLGREGALGSGTVGMSCYTTACTIGDIATDWYGLPDVNHPMIMVNMYRLWRRDGSDRLEQIGQGWIKHGFASANADECGFGCNTPPTGQQNGPGCSDTYAASQFVACDLGPRSMIHPYSGVMPSSADMGPSGGCGENFLANDHRDHVHDAISHRVQVQDADLFPSLNIGAHYLVEGQYVVPHEFVDGNGTQNNNASHRHVSVNGPDACGQIVFRDLGETFAQQPAVNAWPGASQSLIEPFPLADGQGFLVYKVTDLGGAWRYDYSLYNMNMDASMGSLSIPLPAGVVVTNIGFHAPLNHAPEPHTENYDNDPWTVSTSGGAVTWSTDSFGADPFANAVRWGTAYNFYFDANTPPAAVSATVGIFKTGGTVVAPALGPGAGPIDCNNNSVEDRCDVDCGLPGCSVAGCGTKADCNGNFVPDDCEPDCNGNSTADRCDISSAFSADCDGDAVPDECEPFIDCNSNLVRDDCETYADPTTDTDNDGVPDSCAPSGAPAHVWFVDDDAPNDPLPASALGSDPFENGSLAHPFDTIEEAVSAAQSGDTVVVRDGLYAGIGNTWVTVYFKSITIHSENGPENCVVDLERFNNFLFFSGSESFSSRLEGFRIINLATGAGSASAIFANTRITIDNCRFAVTVGGGTKGISAFDNSLVLSDCTFDGVFLPVVANNSHTLVTNCRIRGGNVGIDIAGGNGTETCIGASVARIVNTTVSGANTGIRFSSATIGSVENSIVWGNVATQIQGPVSTVVSYSDVQGGFAGTGNINVDPSFVDPGFGDLRLSNGSPCIDAGNSAAADLPSLDLSGGPRSFDDPGTVDTGAGGPPVVDMGAYEWRDCNGNGMDDALETDMSLTPDCDGDSVPDSCESVVDCNTNTTDDSCDIALGSSGDCNVNGIPDECDTGIGGGSLDCDANQLPDECQADCQGNGVADECDILNATSQDCTGNGIADECEPDCQPNGVADTCDIASASSQDDNGNGVPDECETPPPPTPTWDCPGGLGQAGCAARTRALTFRMVPPATATGASGSSAIQITMLDLQNPVPANDPCCPPPNFSEYESATCTAGGEMTSCARWVGPPYTYLEAQELPGNGNYRATRLQCTPYYDDWENEPNQTVNVVGAEILPSSTYAVRSYGSDCKGTEGTCTNVSADVTIMTRRAGDIATAFQDPTAVRTQPNAIDCVGAINNFKKISGAPKHLEAQVQPNLPNLNRDVDALDIQAVVANQKLAPYPFSGPCPCPSTVVCNATACSGTIPCSGTNICMQTCSAGPRMGELCTSNKHCGMCVGGSRPGIPCDNSSQCDGGTCTPGTCNTQGFCRDRCGRCN